MKIRNGCDVEQIARFEALLQKEHFCSRVFTDAEREHIQKSGHPEATAAATQTLLDAGCTIEENPDKAAFQEIAMGVWSLFTDKYGTELLDMIQG